MTNINVVTVSGKLTRDLEIKQITETFAIGTTSVAVNRSVKKGDAWENEASFFDLKLLGKTATNLAQYLKKGTTVFVEGTLIQERWEKDGVKNSRVVIQAERIEFSNGQRRDGETPASEEWPEEPDF